MIRRAALLGLLCTAALAAEPAAACIFPPPPTTPAERAAAAKESRRRQAELDSAEAVFAARVSRGTSQRRLDAVRLQALRGAPPARTDVGPQNTCTPIWKPGDRLVVYATRRGGQWVVVRAEPDTPAARAAVRRRSAP